MTILFKEDWALYPTATIHYETKNTSFLKIASIYQKLGVENCAFMLALVQPELRHVDPYDPNLDQDTLDMIVAESKINFWYWLREVVRVPVPGSLEPVRFKADRANIALYWMYFNHVTTLITIIRQTGKTTMLMVLVKYLLNIGSVNSFINLLTKNDSLRTETLIKLKELFEELPDYLDNRGRGDVFNSEEANISTFKNKFKGNVSSSSPKAAEKVGRGLTSANNIIDEAAFIENIAIAMGAMLMSGNAARKAAREQGRPYGTLLATTAGDIDDRDGGYIYQLVCNSTRMSEKFFDAKNQADLHELIFKNSRARGNATKRPLLLIEYSHRQLGYSDEWLEQQLSDNISTPENIKRDLFGIWLSGSSTSPLPKAMIDRLKESQRVDIDQYLYAPHNYMLDLLVTRQEFDNMVQRGDSFIIGTDTSDGVGRDDISFVVRNHTTGEVVLGALFNELNLITLADFFSSFLIKYKNSTMIIERKSSAPTMIDYMITKLIAAGENPFKRMYNSIIQEKERYPREYADVMSGRVLRDETMLAKYRAHIGFKTSSGGVTARSELYSTTLMQMLKYTATNTRWKPLIEQISQLVLRNNRIDHPKGGSDDAVIASLLSFWLLITGKNLGDYGIDSSRILRDNNVYLEDKYNTSLDEMDQESIRELEYEFNGILEQLKRERIPTIAHKLELKLKMLADELNTNGNIVSVEELLEDIKRKKRMAKY